MSSLVAVLIGFVFIIIVLQLKEVNKVRLIINGILALILFLVAVEGLKADIILSTVLSLMMFIGILLAETTGKMGINMGGNKPRNSKRKNIVAKDISQEDMFTYSETIVDDFSKNKLGSSTVFLFDNDMEEEERAIPLGNLLFNGDTLGALFQKGSHLGEGAVVVKGGVITHANLRMPVISDPNYQYTNYGSRNKGGLGVVRKYNCVCVTTSAEDGSIRIFHRDTRGEFHVDMFTSFDHSIEGIENITPNDLSLVLMNMMSIGDNNRKKSNASNKKNKTKSKKTNVKKEKPVKKEKLDKNARKLQQEERKKQRELDKQAKIKAKELARANRKK